METLTESEQKRLGELMNQADGNILSWAYNKMDVDPCDFLDGKDQDEFLYLINKQNGTLEEQINK